MPPRLSHKKSRLGCLYCKQRRVKCDEKRPSCSACIRHNHKCEYPRFQHEVTPRRSGRTSGSISDPVKQPGGQEWDEESKEEKPEGLPAFETPEGRILELELMHAFCVTITVGYEDKFRELWVTEVPRWGMRCDHLLHAMYAFAAMGLTHCSWSDTKFREEGEYLDLAYYFFNLALKEQRAQLEHPETVTEPQTLFFSCQLTNVISLNIHRLNNTDPAFAGNNSIFWFTLASKMRYIWVSFEAALEKSKLGTIMDETDFWSPESFNEAHRRPFLELLSFGEDFEAMTSQDRQCYNDAAAWVGRLYQVLERGEEQSSVVIRRFLSMPPMIEPRFVELVVERRPRAIAILAYHFASIKGLKTGPYWREGLAEYHTKALEKMLPNAWKPKVQLALEIASAPSGKCPKLWS